MVKVIQNNRKEILSFTDLFEKYSQDVFRYSLSILGDEDEAKDAVQESFARYFENENSFKGDCSQKTWLLVITRNYCYSRIKKAERSNEKIDEETLDTAYEPRLEESISLKEAFGYLSHFQNEMLFLKEYQGYSYKEIAELTGQSLENVKIILFRARQKLRKILKG